MSDEEDFVACKFYLDLGTAVDRTADGNFIIGILIPELDSAGIPVENAIYTSITSAEKLVRDLTEAIDAAKSLDKEHNGKGA